MTTTWSDIVARGQMMKVPSQTPHRDGQMSQEYLKLYEIEEYADLMKIHRAESVLEMALHSNTVIFEFLSSDFENPRDVYSKLSKDLGTLTGARIIKPNIGRNTGTFMVEARFETQQIVNSAISKGIEVNEKQYKAIPSRNEDRLPKMVKVHVVGVPFEDTKELTASLKSSLALYGKVCRIMAIKQAGVFEGAITALLD
ncbi:hypothetical protein BCR42DRAFT_338966, partial [Absidia repens]